MKLESKYNLNQKVWCCENIGTIDRPEWKIHNLTIGLIRLQVENITPDGICDNIGFYKAGLNKYKVEYMAYETGIGSGNVYREDSLFPDLESVHTEVNQRKEVMNLDPL